MFLMPGRHAITKLPLTPFKTLERFFYKRVKPQALRKRVPKKNMFMITRLHAFQW
jgi:hypothetical protein